MPSRKRVGIFRLQLFKASEKFIESQARELRRYSPIFVGRKVFGAAEGASLAIPVGHGMAADISNLVRIAVLRQAGPFVSALSTHRPDLIHAHFAIDGVFALPVAEQLGVPLITTLHGFDVTRSDWDMLKSGRPSLMNGVLWRRQLQERAHLFICVSEFIKRAALSRGFPADRLCVHYIGIDCQTLRPRSGVGEDGLMVHVGRLVEKKGTTYLLRALAAIKPSFPNAKLVVIGDGPLRPSLEEEAIQLGIADSVQFLGVRPNSEVLRWISRAAVKVVPSVTASDGDMEGFGIVNIEAGAQGVPVIGFDSGGISEAVKNGHSGLLVPERDVDGLAASITNLLGDPAARARIGANARRHVEQHFNIALQTSKLEGLYDAVLRGR